MIIKLTGKFTVTVNRKMLNVTSLHRPDVGWTHFDANGHRHEWYLGNEAAVSYDPNRAYTTPTLKWVVDGYEYWPDSDEPHEVGHHECVTCGERVEPRYCADTYDQFVAGAQEWTAEAEVDASTAAVCMAGFMEPVEVELSSPKETWRGLAYVVSLTTPDIGDAVCKISLRGVGELVKA